MLQEKRIRKENVYEIFLKKNIINISKSINILLQHSIHNISKSANNLKQAKKQYIKFKAHKINNIPLLKMD